MLRCTSILLFLQLLREQRYRSLELVCLGSVDGFLQHELRLVLLCGDSRGLVEGARKPCLHASHERRMDFIQGHVTQEDLHNFVRLGQ